MLFKYKFKNLDAELDIDNVPDYVSLQDLIVEAVAHHWKRIEDLVAWRNAGDITVTNELFRRLIQAHIDREFGKR